MKKAFTALLIALLASGCGGGTEEPRRAVLRGEAMGTTWSVVLRDEARATEKTQQRIADAIDSVDRAMSTWIEDSEVSRFNRTAKGTPVAFSEETAEVVACALQVWRQSRGAFDMTVGGEGSSEDLVFDEKAMTLSKTREGVTIDLSAIAKGYAVDRVAGELDSLGIEDYLVEIGGELRARGYADADDPWTVGIEQPHPGERHIAGTVDVVDLSVATSGNYRQQLHLIDPSSGKAIEQVPTAVCVLHESAMVADAWATALFVTGVVDGIPLAEEQGLAVAFLPGKEDDHDPEIVLSSAFRKRGATFGEVKDSHQGDPP